MGRTVWYEDEAMVRALVDDHARLTSALAQANKLLAQRTEEAERARRIADDACRAKAEFLAAMSHELRTPLNAIAGHAQLIDLGVYGPLNEKQREAIDRIQRNQRRLLALVDEILNLKAPDAPLAAPSDAPVPGGSEL